MKGFPPWPGKIIEPLPDVKKPADKNPKQFVFFFGSENYAWIQETTIWSFVKHKSSYTNPSRTLKGFQEGVQTATQLTAHLPPEKESGGGDAVYVKKDFSPIKNRKIFEKTSTTPPTSGKKRFLEKYQSSQKSSEQDGPSIKKASFDAYDFNDNLSDSFPDLLHSEPPRNIIATPMRIGFLGLGMVGRGMVHNLLKSGHEVTVWNRTTSKCNEFTNAGALKGSTPCEVIDLCDITFSCVADPSALKDLVFGSCGVLQGIRKGKGYVDMSTVDVETINDVQESIVSKGGRFLEAPMIGNRLLGMSGRMVVLAAGNYSLYEDCFSCFQSVSKHMFYLGEVGMGTKMKLVLTLIYGSALAGLAECLALSTKLGLDNTEVMRVISRASANSAFIQEKGLDMIKYKVAEPSCKLQVMQKEMKLALHLSDSVDQALHVSSAVNELFKKAKAKGYSEDDIASLYRAADL